MIFQPQPSGRRTAPSAEFYTRADLLTAKWNATRDLYLEVIEGVLGRMGSSPDSRIYKYHLVGTEPDVIGFLLGVPQHLRRG